MAQYVCLREIIDVVVCCLGEASERRRDWGADELAIRCFGKASDRRKGNRKTEDSMN